jgi:hypothetical protein
MASYRTARYFMFNRSDRSSWRSLVQIAYMLVLALLLLAGADTLWQRACTADASHTALDGAVVRAGSGMIQQDGATVTLPVEAIEVQNLGAATVMVGYDPAVLQVDGCQRNPAFDAGMCNPQFDRDDDGLPDAVRFNVVSLEGLSPVEEAPLNLADITWAEVREPCLEITSTLEVEVLTFSGWDGIPITVSAENGRVTVVTDLAGDLDSDGDVDVADVMMVASRWSCQLGDECYDAYYDFDGDGDIDIADVMHVAVQWGKDCSPSVE